MGKDINNASQFVLSELIVNNSIWTKIITLFV